MTALAPTLEAFFTDRLVRQQRASPNTVAAYRDSFRLLLAYLQDCTGKTPSCLAFDDVDVNAVTGFLGHLEAERTSSLRTRNARLAAVKRSSGSRRCGTPSTLPSSNASSPFLISARRESSSST